MNSLVVLLARFFNKKNLNLLLKGYFLYIVIALIFYVSQSNSNSNLILVPFLHNNNTVFDIVFITFVLLSALIFVKKYAENKVYVYWGYISVLSFSLFGSIAVATFSTTMPLKLGIPLVMILAHIGWWSWNKEFERKKEQEDITQNSTQQLSEYVGNIGTSQIFLAEKIESLNLAAIKISDVMINMPDTRVLKKVANRYSSLRPSLVMLYSHVLPILQDFKKGGYTEDVLTSSQINEYINIINHNISNILTSFSYILKNWLLIEDNLEANVLLLKPSKDVKWDEEYFKNGECFFPDGTLEETIEHICEGILVSDCSIPYERVNDKIDPQLPIFLPVGLSIPEYIIPGAPEACQKNVDVCISDVSKTFSELDIYTKEKQKAMLKYFTEKRGCTSLISIRIPSPDSLLHEEESCYLYNCMGVINIYSTQNINFNNLTVLRDVALPLIQFVSDFLYYRNRLQQLLIKKG